MLLLAINSVDPVDQRRAVRVGSDVLVRIRTKDEAVLEAAWRAQAIRRLGGSVPVVEKPLAAVELRQAL